MEPEGHKFQVMVYKYVYVNADSADEAEELGKKAFLACVLDYTVDELHAEVESVEGEQ